MNKRPRGRKSSPLLGDIGHGLGQMAHITGGDSGDGNPAVLGEVNTVLLGDLLHLLRRHPGEGKHSNLIGDVFPVTRRTFTSASQKYISKI